MNSVHQRGILQGLGIMIHSAVAGPLVTIRPEHQRTAKRPHRQDTMTIGLHRMEGTATTARTTHLLPGKTYTLRLHRTEATHQHQPQRLQHLSNPDTRRMHRHHIVVSLRHLWVTEETMAHGMMS